MQVLAIRLIITKITNGILTGFCLVAMGSKHCNFVANDTLICHNCIITLQYTFLRGLFDSRTLSSICKLLLLVSLLLAAMTYNQVQYFRINHLAGEF